MNTLYLGDALDFWKGALISHLLNNDVLKDLTVDPMITDDKWESPAIVTYKALLRIEQTNVAVFELDMENREDHLSQVGQHHGDLFLDPDTGIATSSPKKQLVGQYVFPDELCSLLQAQKARVVAVYQHVRAQRTRDRGDTCIKTVEGKCPALSWCSYESGTVAMLFFCLDKNRISGIKNQLRQLVPGSVVNRVFPE